MDTGIHQTYYAWAYVAYIASGKLAVRYGEITSNHHVSWVNQLFLWSFSIANRKSTINQHVQWMGKSTINRHVSHYQRLISTISVDPETASAWSDTHPVPWNEQLTFRLSELVAECFFSWDGATLLASWQELYIPIGSMVLVYMLTWLGYIDGKCYHI